MTTALIYFSASLVILIFLSVLYRIEDIRGKRVVLSRIRSLTDIGLITTFTTLRQLRHRVWDGFVHIVLRYGVHTFLGATLAFLKGLEQRVEIAVRRNRQAVRSGKRVRNHLDEIADHKESVALSEEEKQKLKDR